MSPSSEICADMFAFLPRKFLATALSLVSARLWRVASSMRQPFLHFSQLTFSTPTKAQKMVLVRPMGHFEMTDLLAALHHIRISAIHLDRVDECVFGPLVTGLVENGNANFGTVAMDNMCLLQTSVIPAIKMAEFALSDEWSAGILACDALKCARSIKINVTDVESDDNLMTSDHDNLTSSPTPKNVADLARLLDAGGFDDNVRREETREVEIRLPATFTEARRLLASANAPFLEKMKEEFLRAKSAAAPFRLTTSPSAEAAPADRPSLTFSSSQTTRPASVYCCEKWARICRSFATEKGLTKSLSALDLRTFAHYV